MKEKVLEKIDLYTSADTLLGAQSVLDDTGDSATERAIKMANAGQPALAIDHLAIALKREDIEPNEAVEILLVGLDKQANFYRNRGDSVRASEVRKEAREFRDLISS